MATSNDQKYVDGKIRSGKRGGRPRKEVTPQILEVMDEYEGPATMHDLSKYLNVSRAKIQNWMKENEEFAAAVTRARDKADDIIENSFFERAKGYTIEINEQKIDKDGCTHDLVKDVHLPADPGAALNWLKNRRPDQWRDKKVVEVEGDHVTLLEKALRGEI